MSEIRKMIRKVNKYVILICKYPDEAKKDCKNYIDEVESLKKEVDDYIEKAANDFSIYANQYVELWAMDERSTIIKTKKWVKLCNINEELNKLSKNLSDAGILQNNIEKILIRLKQFEAFCLH